MVRVLHFTWIASYFLGLASLLVAIGLRIAAMGTGAAAQPAQPSHVLLLAATFFLCALSSRAAQEAWDK